MKRLIIFTCVVLFGASCARFHNAPTEAKDEPLTFLDIRHQIDFMKRIRSFTNTADVVTVGVVHDLNLAARFADQILMWSSESSQQWFKLRTQASI